MKKKITVGLLFLAAISAGILVELFVYNSKKADETIEMQIFPLSEINEAVTLEQAEVWEPLSEEEQNSIFINRENQKILAQVNGTEYKEEDSLEEKSLLEKEGKLYRKKIESAFTIRLPQTSYIRKIHIGYDNLQENVSYVLQVKNKDTEVFQGYDGIIDAKIKAAAVNVGRTGDTLIFTIKTEEKPDLNGLKVSVVNLTSMNWLRVLFIAAAILLVGSLFLGKKIFYQKPEVVFAGFSLALGTLLILCIGTNQIGFDEYAHSTRAYEISFGGTIETTESAMRMKANDLPVFHNREERSLVEAYEDVNHDFSWANITTRSRFISYQDRSYLPIALFFKLGRILKMPFAWMIMFGKWGNLLFFTLLGFLAIKYAKTGKGMAALLALLPNVLFAAAGITYDAVVNGFLLLAVVLTANLLLEEDKVTWLQVLLILGAYIAGSTAKPVYMVMAFMLVFLSEKRFETKLQCHVFRGAVTALVALLLYTIFFPPVSANANYELMSNLAYAGDKRNAGTSVLGQLQYILANPFIYTKLLLSSMVTGILRYGSGMRQFFNYGYLGGLHGMINIAGELLLLYAAVGMPKEEKRVLPGRYKILNAIMIFGMSAMIATSMYVSYTPVGSPEIQGVQARYFLPLFLPFCYCIVPRKSFGKWSREAYYKVLFGFCLLVNLYAIYTLALRPLNF